MKLEKINWHKIKTNLHDFYNATVIMQKALTDGCFEWSRSHKSYSFGETRLKPSGQWNQKLGYIDQSTETDKS